jgi:hypothetical protein
MIGRGRGLAFRGGSRSRGRRARRGRTGGRGCRRPLRGLSRSRGGLVLGRRTTGRRRRRRPGLRTWNDRRGLRWRRLRSRFRGRRFRSRPAPAVPSPALLTFTGALHRGRRLVRLVLGRPTWLHPERRDQPAHGSGRRLLRVRADATLTTGLRSWAAVRRTSLHGIRPGRFGGLRAVWCETPGPGDGVGRSVHASSLVRPPDGHRAQPIGAGGLPRPPLSQPASVPIPPTGSGG